ncbi:hypothetical protein CAG99_26395 [Streptomyces marincola]|uniref:Uncharacterized protein n=1 Tax=Streptomyces marincola TaxID=2878388 RepID=A0A1W7D5M2_9ACTN|nr:hypothetical protein CAG99_26395 [Streptomyces marincola]
MPGDPAAPQVTAASGGTPGSPGPGPRSGRRPGRAGEPAARSRYRRRGARLERGAGGRRGTEASAVAARTGGTRHRPRPAGRSILASAPPDVASTSRRGSLTRRARGGEDTGVGRPRRGPPGPLGYIGPS